MQKYIYDLEKHNENLKEKLFQAKNINIDEIVKRQNDRHKENAEQKLKEKEIQHKELEERQNIKSATFCNFCELYQNNKSHFCNLFKKWIRVDNINLVFLQGASQDDVEPTAKDGKTKSTAIIKTYATRTNMFNDLQSLKQIEIEIIKEQKKKEDEIKQKEKKMAEEDEKKMAEEEDKKEQGEMKRQQEEEEELMSQDKGWNLTPRQKWEEEKEIMREKRGSRRLRRREDTDYDKEEETEYENRRTSYHENNRNKSKSEIEKEERGTNVRSRIMP